MVAMQRVDSSSSGRTAWSASSPVPAAFLEKAGRTIVFEPTRKQGALILSAWSAG